MNLSAFLLLLLLPLTYVQAQGTNGNGKVGQGGGNGNGRVNRLDFKRCRKGESDKVDICDIDVPAGTAWINEDDVEVVVGGTTIRCMKKLSKYDSLGGAPGQKNWYVPIVRNGCCTRTSHERYAFIVPVIVGVWCCGCKGTANAQKKATPTKPTLLRCWMKTERRVSMDRSCSKTRSARWVATIRNGDDPFVSPSICPSC
jgi:hypothetical protein